MSSRRPFLLSAFLLAAIASGGIAGTERRAAAWQALEPVESLRDTVLLSTPGRARVRSLGASQRIRLRRGERLLEIAEVRNGWLAAGVVERGNTVDLTFVRGGKSSTRRLPRLVERSPGLRGRPRLMLERDRLAGIAWLEGRGFDSLSVKASDWTGVDWSPSESVSWGDAIRTGLTSAVLEDGSWLLVWSQYDGNDDELFWSLREGATWSTPAPVTGGNSHPDVTPQLLPLDHGAILAWSRSDGDHYRVHTARFERGRWRTLGATGPAGSVDPSFKRTPEGSLLVFRNAVPSAWTALRLDRRGAVSGLARVPTALSPRPVVRPASSGEIVFDWPLLKHQRRQRWERPVR